jgi:hypothetical protein
MITAASNNEGLKRWLNSSGLPHNTVVPFGKFAAEA